MCGVMLLQRTSWAQQQVETACDFAPQSLLWDILSGGVHIQVHRRVEARMW